MQTSNFRTAGSHPNAAAISRGIPDWYRGRVYDPLRPTRVMLAPVNLPKFDADYAALLAKLDPRKVWADLGADAVLLCFEEPLKYACHRRMVAEWLEETLGVEIPEVGHDRSESLPYHQQPWKRKPDLLQGVLDFKEDRDG